MSKEIKSRSKPKVATIVCIALIILLLPMLAFNLTMIIKGMIDKKNPPSVFGIIPLAVLSGSMDDGSPDCIKIGDMIFVRKTDLNELKEGDIITFSIGDDYITHRIVEIQKTDGSITGFVTKGDANNTTDGIIPPENVYGKYFKRVPNLGNFVIFLQTPLGIIIFVGVPFAAYIIIDVTQRLSEKRKVASAVKEEETADDKDAEIERLRALLATQQKENEQEEKKKDTEKIDSVNSDSADTDTK